VIIAREKHGPESIFAKKGINLANSSMDCRQLGMTTEDVYSNIMKGLNNIKTSFLNQVRVDEILIQLMKITQSPIQS